MKILHLYSDWKWTGPAEPVLQMCHGLQERGHDVQIAYSAAPRDEEETVGKKVKSYHLNGTEAFALDRHIPPRKTLNDFLTLPRYISTEKVDIVHTHLTHDHAFGGLCVKRLGGNRPTLVRTLHRRSVLKNTLGNRILLKRLTDAWLTFTPAFRQTYIERFRLPPDRVGIQPLTIDTERFNPAHGFRDMRKEFDIPADAPLIGIVGRYQKYRKMDIFLPAAQRVLSEVPEAHFLVIGRSSQMEKTVVTPSVDLGIRDRIVLPGYRIEDYADTLACLDIFTLLMPGFDGTARAVREALALGIPCVVSDFGMLPEIVHHGETGLVSPMEPDALAERWLRLIRDRDARLRMGKEARRDAVERFRMGAVGPSLEGFYHRITNSQNVPS